MLIDLGFLILPYTTSHGITLDIVYLPSKEPICTFNTNGPSSYNAHIVPKITDFRYCINWLENKNDLDYGQEEVEQIHNSLMGTIIGNVKVVNCGRLEDIEEGAELLIKAIRPIGYRSKTKYILEFENIPNKYVSNYWLERELEDVDQNYKIKIKCDRLKTTPSKNMERMVFCT